jgi:hypothetical protein
VLLRYFYVAIAWCLLCPHPSDAADLTKLSRKIAKEPVYTGKPLYCLVAFGPELRPCVWLVLDGDILYVDRNSNGDLTEPAKRFHLKAESPGPDGLVAVARNQFPDVEIEAADHIKRKLSLYIYDWRPGHPARPEENGPSLTIWDHDGRVYGSWGDQDSAVIWSERPETAPVLRFGGPLQMGFEVRAKNAFTQKTKDTYELNVGIGTYGFGKGTFVHLKYWNNAIPEQLQPKAVLEFANKTPGGQPVRVEVTLSDRC